MSALPLEVELGDTDDGDDGPGYSWADFALAFARVLHAVSERGPLFKAAIDAEFANLRKE